MVIYSDFKIRVLGLVEVCGKLGFWDSLSLSIAVALVSPSLLFLPFFSRFW